MANNTTEPSRPHPVILRQVANGYVVEGLGGEFTARNTMEDRVFQSFNELHGFLRSHFTHRSPLLSSDTGSEP
jgi:hypothetical protein